MALVKCPRCELNYMQDSERYCTVCRREMHGEADREELEICPECGERPVAPGEDYCVRCLKEFTRHERELAGLEGGDVATPDEVVVLDSASEMEEIDIDTDEEIPSDEFSVINKELELEDEDEAEEDFGASIDIDSDLMQENVVSFEVLEADELNDDDDLEDE